jgi:hypothetical protein
MGDFRIVIEATGGHGCNRTAKAGEEFFGCGSETCPDCMTARFVSDLQRACMRPFVATFTHWPADMNDHHFVPGADRCSRCNRTKEEIAKFDAEHAGDAVRSAPRCSRSYTEEREVVDDLSERGVKHPSGAFRRVTVRRVKGNF